MPDGSSVKRAAVTGLEFAKLSLEELSKRTSNECFAADRNTHQVVAQMNMPLAGRSIKRIFQIAYDEESRLQRAELLLGCGYGVISVLGNEAAKVLLSSIQHYDLFIVGHAAPEETRREMVLAQGEIPGSRNPCLESASSTSPQSRLQRETERSGELAADCRSTISGFP